MANQPKPPRRRRSRGKAPGPAPAPVPADVEAPPGPSTPSPALEPPPGTAPIENPFAATADFRARVESQRQRRLRLETIFAVLFLVCGLAAGFAFRSLTPVVVALFLDGAIVAYEVLVASLQ